MCNMPNFCYHHYTYHIGQASQTTHGSLVDRGANGGLAGSDVKILSRSSRRCTVAGIDSHEIPEPLCCPMYSPHRDKP